jgi:hypothetical protein
MLHPLGRRAALRTFGFSLGVLGIAGTAVVSAADPAAAQGTRPCAAYYYCFYEHINYGGWQLQYQSTSFGDLNHPPATSRTGVRDQVSSIINNTGRTICVYSNRLTGRDILTVRPYQDYPDLRVATYNSGKSVNFNDKADYWRVVSATESCPPE